eukprot:1840999-Pyramimonas_sp.AAC.1
MGQVGCGFMRGGYDRARLCSRRMHACSSTIPPHNRVFMAGIHNITLSRSTEHYASAHPRMRTE